MALKAYYASAAYDPTVTPRVPLAVEVTAGNCKSMKSTQATAAADNAASTINFGKINRDARISRKSDLFATAMSGLTSFSLGFANSTAALMSAVDIHAGGVFNMTAPAYADFVKPAWQLAGYTDENSAPAELDIIGTMVTAPVQAGAITLDLFFATN
jgi:hypothetical protein